MARVLITGGTGVVAQNLASNLSTKEYDVLLATRGTVSALPVPTFRIGNIDGETNWKEALHKIDIVIHLAAHTPQLASKSGASKEMSLKKFMSVNRDGTECLARAAVASGVKRFIYLSSILAVGDHTIGEAVFSSAGQPKKDDGYGVSKRKGEDSLLLVAKGTALEVVILRVPPIYGPGVTNNILTMFKAISYGWPLPLKTIKNRLSFIYIDNLVSAITVMASYPNAINKTYFVCDQEEVSSPQFLMKIAAAMEKNVRLFPFPLTLLRLIGVLAGQQFAAGRLINSLRVDGSDFCKELNWEPPITMDAGLKATAEWYLTINKK